MNSRSLLNKINQPTSNATNAIDRIEKFQCEIEHRDQVVLDYLKVRGTNHDFRVKAKAILNQFKSRRGPKPDGLAPLPFYELINSIKKTFGLRSYSKALEAYCDLHDLPPEKASSLEDKFRRGREEKTKNKGS